MKTISAKQYNTVLIKQFTSIGQLTLSTCIIRISRKVFRTQKVSIPIGLRCTTDNREHIIKNVKYVVIYESENCTSILKKNQAQFFESDFNQTFGDINQKLSMSKAATSELYDVHQRLGNIDLLVAIVEHNWQNLIILSLTFFRFYKEHD